MAKKIVKVEFVEQSKAVTAQVKIEVEDDDVNGEQILDEAKALFNKASEYSALKTMQKNR